LRHGSAKCSEPGHFEASRSRSRANADDRLAGAAVGGIEDGEGNVTANFLTINLEAKTISVESYKSKIVSG
jgi:hypothetical protein